MNTLNNTYDFKELLNTNNLTLFYTQMLNAKRLKGHDAVYVFDEVGCGKTISAILAIAKTIWDSNNNYNILVITPKNVCPQFKKEILNKLRFGETIHNIHLNEDIVEDISNFGSDDIKNKITEISKNSAQNNHIVIANPHKMCKLKLADDQRWNLIIVDEAHDIVCNNKEQTASFNNSIRITSAYDTLLEKIPKIANEAAKKVFLDNTEKINVYNDEAHKIFFKLMLSIHYNEFFDDKIAIPKNRTDIKLYQSLLRLKAVKVMFLTATPYKNLKEPDFLNYGYAATKITSDDFIFAEENVPNLSWVKNLYNKQFTTEDLQEIENANTSMFFKEVVNSIPFDLKTDSSAADEHNTKHRFIDIWDPDNLKYLPAYLVSLNNREIPKDFCSLSKGNYTADKINRAIIFVSCSAEGDIVFKKIFGNKCNYTLSQIAQHYYTDTETGLICEFIMNKFNNTNLLNLYSKERTEQDSYIIPDILIVTWQVAQVGVNLPTFNHVIHYNISHLPGDIEQRFGRIDRMTTNMHNLHNIYCFEKGSTSHYNLTEALTNYKLTLLSKNCNLPVKNTLLCEELKLPKYDSDSTVKFINYYINITNQLQLDSATEDLNKRISTINSKLNDNGFPLITLTNNVLENLNGIYYDETSGLSKVDLESTDTSESSTAEAIKNFIKIIDHLLDVLANQEKFNKQIDEINGTNYPAGTIIYVDPDDSSDEKSSEKYCVSLEEVVQRIREARSNRNL